ncbi:MAG: S8 family serine peptidase [Candidatus Hatepunaea meridiana]|nr:S8 family serine peptidase [Candidatus Hatepunaea meridiana]
MVLSLIVSILFLSGEIHALTPNPNAVRNSSGTLPQLRLPDNVPLKLNHSSFKSKYPKLESALARFINLYQTSTGKDALAFALDHEITIDNERVLCELLLHNNYLPEDITKEQLDYFSAEIVTISKHYITLWIPISELDNIGTAIKSIALIHRPYRPVEHVVSEGVEVIGAEDYHDEGINGRGVKVGVIDHGFEDYSELQDEEELPPDLTFYNFSFEGWNFGGVHGVACAEIIYDLAPEVDLHLLKCIFRPDYENAIEYLVNESIKISTMSLGWDEATVDYYAGGDYMSQAVNWANENGVLFITSAGNQAKGHYRADFDDMNDGNNQHRFARGYSVNHFGPDDRHPYLIPEDYRINVHLAWDDFPETDQDLDLYLAQYDAEENTWTVADESENEQDGDDPPIENISFRVREQGYYGIAVITTNEEDDIDFTLFTRLDFGFNTPEGSVTIPALSEAAFAVGAVNFSEWDEEEPETEEFSSQGPTYSDILKPNLCAPDGVSSITYENGFFGTSSASPHVAGAAALLSAADGEMSNLELWNTLQILAEDAGEEGEDNVFGHGLLHLNLEMELDQPQIRTDPEGGERINLEIHANQCFISDVFTIGNDAEEGARHLNFTILTRQEEDQEFRNNIIPQRDDGGDVIEEYEVPYRETSDLTWDGNLMWGVSYDDWNEQIHLISLDPEENEIVDDFNLPEDAVSVAFNGENLLIGFWESNRILEMNLDGEEVEWHESPVQYHNGLTCDGENYIFMSESRSVYILSIHNYELIHTFNCSDVLGDIPIGSLTIIPNEENTLWVLVDNGVIRLSWDEEWEFERISNVSLNNGHRRSIGIAHNGVNLWRGSTPLDRGRWVIHDDVNISIPWLTGYPRMGYIAPGAELDIGLNINPRFMDEDEDYQGILVIRSNDEENNEITIPFNLHTTDNQFTIRNVPDDFDTIQEAIISAFQCDTILVQQGRYYENLNFLGKDITVASSYLTTYNSEIITQTIIDGGGNNPCVTFENGEGSDASLIGFTLINGTGVGYGYWESRGGGILCERNSNPTLSNLIITENSASYGGGIYSSGSDGMILDSLQIYDNIAQTGSALFLQMGNYTITHTLIANNNGRICMSLENDANVLMRNVTVAGNVAQTGCINISNRSQVRINNSILWNNTPREIASNSRMEPNLLEISYSDSRNGEDNIRINDDDEVDIGEGFINEDPLFEDYNGSDFRITFDSPCIDTGDPDIEDPDATRSDMGAYYFKQAPQISLSPDRIDFEDVRVDQDSTIVVQIENSGVEDLIISNIEVDGEYFSVEFEDEITIEPNNDVSIECVFTPEEEGVFEGSIVISTNIFDQEIVTIPISGIGTIPHPPEVVMPIEDLELEEDFDPMEVADLDEVFTDPDEDVLIFHVETDDANIIAELDDDNILILTGHENWYGQCTVTVIADDQTEDERVLRNVRRIRSFVKDTPRRDLTTVLEFNVTVTPINDAPIVLNNIPDFEVDEDTYPWEIADLDTIFFDVDEEDELLFVFPEEYEDLEFRIEQDSHVLFIDATEHFNTEAIELVIVADDQNNNRLNRNLRYTNNHMPVTISKPQSGRRVRKIKGRIRPPYRDDSVDEHFMFTINPVNDSPYWIDPPDEVQCPEGRLLEIPLLAHDVDLDNEGDIIRLQVINNGGTFDRGAEFEDIGEGQGLFSWQTDFEDEGRYNVIFRVTDRVEVNSLNVSIIITHVNQPPEIINPIDDIVLNEDFNRTQIADLNEVFNDPDDDPDYSRNDPEGISVIIEDNILYFESVSNWSGEADVRITVSDGNNSVTDEIVVTVNPVNDAPLINFNIEDIIIEEDHGQYDIADLDEVFSDPENDSLSFELIDPSHQLNLEIDPEWNLLCFSADENYFSEDGIEVTIRAIEHPGRLSSDLTFQITITPVNDSPDYFSLISPDNNFHVSRENFSIIFQWEETNDVDGDDVTTLWFIQLVDNDIDTTFSIVADDSISIEVRLDSLLLNIGFSEVNEDISIDAVWWVEASDGEFIIESNERRQLSIPIPLNIYANTHNLPSEFVLYQNYPNPFNSCTQIIFGLPTHSYIRLSIFNSMGKNIEVLKSGWFRKGFHHIQWQSKNHPNGLYFIILETNVNRLAIKTILIN